MKLSKITKGFAVVGFVVGIFVLATGFWLDQHGTGREVSDWFTSYELLLCPASFSLMGLETSASTPSDQPGYISLAVLTIMISSMNAITYGLVGGAISWIWRRARTLLRTSAR